MQRRASGPETVTRAVGGQDTRIGEFPYVALLGKPSWRRPGSIYWHCGGSLINKWYVLTAANCGEVELVRLGEWKVLDPDSYTKTTDDSEDGAGRCFYYNDVSKRKCEEEESCNVCQQSDPKEDCYNSGKYEICSGNVEVRLKC